MNLPPLIDLTGKVFGRLTVLARAENKGRDVAWTCVCECGTTLVVRGSGLRDGTSQSCGCLHRDIVSVTSKPELTGQRFKHLVVIEESGRTAQGETLWECRCDCGDLTWTTSRNLTSGRTGTCGCRDGGATTYGTAHARVRRIRGRADQRNCVDCGSTAQEWSYRGGDVDERQDDRGFYSTNPDCYVPRCISCHRRYDRALAARGGNFGLVAKPCSEELVPGSPEWLRAGVSASRIAGVMNKSPWSSRFSIYHEMAGNLVGNLTESEIQRRGHLLEPSIADWFMEEHPELGIFTTGTWRHAEEPRFIASPDRIICSVDDVELLEIKTAAYPDHWDITESGVPEYYELQAQWMLMVLGLKRCRFAVLTAYLEFREYVVEADQRVFAEMSRAALEFLESLPGGSNYKLPPIDGTDATYQAIRKLTPGIEEGDVVIPTELAEVYVQAVHDLEESEKALRYARSTIADKLGPYKTAVVKLGDEFEKVAYRKNARGGPTLVKSPKLPNLREKLASRVG